MKNFKLNRAVIVTVEGFLFIVSVFLLFWTYDDKTILWGDSVREGVRGYSGMCWQHQGLTAIFWFFMFYMVALLVWEIIAKTDSDVKAPFQKLLERFDINTAYHENGKAAFDNHSHFQSPRNYSDSREDEDTEDTENENNENMKKKFTLKKAIWYVVLIFVVIYGIKFVSTTYKQSKFIFNKSKMYQNNYQQKVEEKLGFYDKLWKTFYEKKRIADINLDAFTELTKIIMGSRAAGEKVTWQWLQENQQISMNEYTKFYTDLSSFIYSQREGYFAIEKQCQVIARQNNTLLDTFPNNIYNRVLKLEDINFEYGFLSDSTNAVFELGTENLE